MSTRGPLDGPTVPLHPYRRRVGMAAVYLVLVAVAVVALLCMLAALKAGLRQEPACPADVRLCQPEKGEPGVER